MAVCEETLNDMLQNMLNSVDGLITDFNILRPLFGSIIPIKKRETWKFLLDIVIVLEYHDCQDRQFITEFVNFIWACAGSVYNITRVGLQFFEPSFRRRRQHLDLTAEELPQNYVQYNITSEIMKLFVTPYESLELAIHFGFDIVDYLAVTGQVGALEMVLRFGAVPVCAVHDVPGYEMYRLWSVISCLFPDSEFKLERHSISRRRQFFMRKYLDVLWRFRLKDPDDTISIKKNILSMELFTKSVPEPLLTCKELQLILEKMIITDKEKIPLLVSEYRSYFTKSNEDSSPRSLKYLCRFTIREAFRASNYSFRLAQGVNLLNLPRKVKDYLLLREDPLGLDPYKMTKMRLPNPKQLFRAHRCRFPNVVW